MIQPTVGRVVWYWPAGVAHTEPPLAAMVAKVWSDTMVNLAVFDANGHAHGGYTSVLLIQDDAAVPSGGFYATWMPYQKGQAARTDAAEARAAGA